VCHTAFAWGYIIGAIGLPDIQGKLNLWLMNRSINQHNAIGVSQSANKLNNTPNLNICCALAVHCLLNEGKLCEQIGVGPC
jgi:hypothetical protein